MATLVLSTAAQALGGAIGGPVGAMAGRAVGALAGGMIDSALTSRRGATKVTEGPRLADLDVQASQEGAPIPQAYGRVRLAGQIIWATRLEEEITVEREGGSGGGKSGRGAPPPSETRTYSYFANLAVGLCEGPITRVSRVWADGKPLDLSQVTMRLHRGGEDEVPDAFIEARQGGLVPAYRGTAYVVFERLALARFGNRIPQLSFEVVRAIGALETKVTAMTIIPGSSEFAYDPKLVRSQTGPGAVRNENRNSMVADTDWTASIDELQDLCPNLKRAALVAAWFGTDLRAGECEVVPGVEWDEKTTIEDTWIVNGVERGEAHVVSRIDGRPAYGGTPSDGSILRAIRDLNARGLKVTFYPFLMMDIVGDDALPDPYGRASQPPYPWRGRITCMPAAGEAGSPDGTAAAEAQIDAFFGTARAKDFTILDGNVVFDGTERSWRRMVLHYAHLAKLAGGVDAFLVGTEMRGLTWVRGASGHPAVRHLRELAAEVRSILGPDAKISYAADWSEYFGHQPPDGSGDVTFHLDDFWSDANCDFIGIDNYMPLSDWRDGDDHADIAAGAPYDRAYIANQIAGGEGYDWYYASAADRGSQSRTPITDGAHAKTWVYRYKDLAGWWTSPHVNRVGGVETDATAWVPRSKPIWFTEVGVPAVDKGGNQPNVFFDPKSSESFLPYHSTGARDDFAQRRGLEVLLDTWRDAGPDLNPTGPAGRMLDPDATHIWTWDARPFPIYPLAEDVWGDGPNWARGHWMTGRLGQAPVAELIAAILTARGITGFDVSEVDGTVDGYVVDRPMSPRDALEPLMLALGIEAYERAGRVVFRSNRHRPAAPVPNETCVDREGRPLMQVVREQEAEIAARVALTFTDLMRDHSRASIGAMRADAGSRHEAHADLPIVSQTPMMMPYAESWLHDLWVGRDGYAFALPPSRLALEAGDIVALEREGDDATVKIERIGRAMALEVEGRRFDRAVADACDGADVAAFPSRRTTALPVATGAPHVRVLELPRLREADPGLVLYAAAHQSPWPGALTVWREGGAGVVATGRVRAPATMGETLSDLPAAQSAVWDDGSALDVRLYAGALQSLPDRSILDGANALAVGRQGGPWEILQFANAELVGPDTYRLTRLLRGQRGTDADMPARLPAGADVVLLDEAVEPLTLTAGDLGRGVSLRIGLTPGPNGSASVAVRPIGLGLRTAPPCHVRAVARGGDVDLNWVRRAREGGDGWFLPHVPLHEREERYRLEVVAPAGVRSVETATAHWTYPAADILSHHGARPDEITVRIAQIGELYGPGAVRDVVLPVQP